MNTYSQFSSYQYNSVKNDTNSEAVEAAKDLFFYVHDLVWDTSNMSKTKQDDTPNVTNVTVSLKECPLNTAIGAVNRSLDFLDLSKSAVTKEFIEKCIRRNMAAIIRGHILGILLLIRKL